MSNEMPTMLCPKCGRDDTLELRITASAHIYGGAHGPFVYDEANHDGSLQWDNFTKVVCTACQHTTYVKAAVTAAEINQAKAKGKPKLYKVTSSVDAYVNYVGLIEAFSLAEALDAARNDNVAWVYFHTSTFDDRELEAEELSAEDTITLSNEIASSTNDDPDDQIEKLKKEVRELKAQLTQFTETAEDRQRRRQ